MSTKQDTNAVTIGCRSKYGWFNWYVNRDRLTLVIPRSKAGEKEWYKTMRQISHRRVI